MKNVTEQVIEYAKVALGLSPLSDSKHISILLRSFCYER